jgi:hypothetical protein
MPLVNMGEVVTLETVFAGSKVLPLTITFTGIMYTVTVVLVFVVAGFVPTMLKL